MRIGQLFVTLSLKANEYNAGLRAAQREGKEFEKSVKPISTLLKDTGAVMTSVGAGLTAGLTVPLAALGGAAIKFGGDFEDAMTQSLAIMGNVSDSMKNELGNAAKEMAKTTVFSAKEGADALFFLSSSGLDAAASMKALPVVANFAQAGVLGLAQSTEFLTDAQAALGLKTNDATKNMENMTRVSDVLVKANVLSNATTQQFAEALTNKAAAALRLVGKEVEEGTAVLAAFASQGVKGAVAGEQLAIVMRDLQAKAISSKDEFKQLGLRVFDASGDMRNMADIIGNLETLLAGMSDEQKKATLTMLGFQDRSVGAMLQLVGTSDAIRGYEQALKSAGGATEEIAGKQMESFKNQMKLLSHQVELLGITLFEAIAPVLKDIVLPALQSAARGLQTLAEWFGALPKPVQAAAIALAAVAAAIGPVLVGAGFMVTQIGGLIPIFLRLSPLLTGSSGLITGFGQALSGLSLLSSVKSFSDLNTAVSLIGQTSLVAKLGMIGLAAGIGIAIGQLINWAIEGTKVREVMDGIARSVGSWLFSGQIAAAMKQGADAETAWVDVIKKHGIAVDSARLGDATYRDGLRLQVVAMEQAKAGATASGKATGNLGAASKAAAGDVDGLNKSLDKKTTKLGEAAKAAQNATKKLEELRLNGMQKLTAEIPELLKAQNFGLDRMSDEFSKSLGDKIKKSEDGLKHLDDLLMKSAESVSRDYDLAIKDGEERQKAASDQYKKFVDDQKAAHQAAIASVRDSAGKIFDDMFIKGENVFASLGNLLKGGALSLGRSIFQDVTAHLLGPIKKAFDDFFSGLLEGVGLKSLISGLGSRLGGALSGLIGGGLNKAGDIIPIVGNSVGEAGSVAGSAGGAAGGIGGIGSSATSAAAGAIQAAASIAGGLISGFMSRGNLKRTEENSRETRDWLELQTTAWNPLFHEMVSLQKWIAEQTTTLGVHLLPAIEFWSQEIIKAINGGIARIGNPIRAAAQHVESLTTETIDALETIIEAVLPGTQGGFLNYGVPKFEEAITKGFLNFGVPKFEETLAKGFLNFGVPKFEDAVTAAVAATQAPMAYGPSPELFGAGAYARVIPTLFGAHAYSGVGGGQPQITIHINAPTTVAPEFIVESSSFTPMQVRDEIMPEMLLDLDLGVRGHAEKLARIIRDKLDGLSGTDPAYGI